MHNSTSLRSVRVAILFLASAASFASGARADIFVLPRIAAVVTAPAPPFNQCPQVGLSPSCGTLLVVNPDRTVSVYTDPAVGPFDGIEDTLIGIRNDSSAPVTAITAYGPPGIFGFDFDGLCSAFPAPAQCPFGPTTYEGPGVSFVTDPRSDADGEIDFAGTGLAAGDSTYFSLEGAVTSATLQVIVGQLSFCRDAGKIPVQHRLHSDGWSFDYGISACEGLVVSNVVLGERPMAERMSLPYLDVETCTSRTDVSGCTSTTSRHITLRADAIEAQTDPAAYTRVHLINSPGNPTPASDASSFRQLPPQRDPCKGLAPCGNSGVYAIYRVDLVPAPAGGEPLIYLDITQRYEFYRDFSERTRDPDLRALSCEPSSFTPPPFGFFVTPLSDCARWKPIVSYDFVDQSHTTLLKSVSAAARLHFTPDALAERASTFIRDCDKNASQDGCPPTGLAVPLFETYQPGNPENAIHQEAAIRALVADPGGTTRPGRYDNVHQTPTHSVVPPLPPPGCPECVHIHWRWGADILGIPAFFGSGQPLIGDSEPAAVPNSLSHQQLDVALVAYHSEELAPNDFMLLVNNANPNDLNMQVPAQGGQFSGGIARGTETLAYPSPSCADRSHLGSWGQCGEVLWMSAKSITMSAHDEDHDKFFAFGGFFCERCANPEYAGVARGLTAVYAAGNQLGSSPNGDGRQSIAVASGSQLTIAFFAVAGGVEVNDVLPKGFTGVTAKSFKLDLTGSTLPPVSCPISTDVDGHPVVTCDLSSQDFFSIVVITATPGGVSPGTYENTIHGIWGPLSFNVDAGGNYKHTDSITVL